MSTKPILAWAIVNEHGRINPDKIFRQKPIMSLPEKIDGFRAIRVLISPVEKKKP